MDQVYKTSIAEIRLSTGLDLDAAYLTYDFGVPGEWLVDESDTTSLDDTGSCIVTADEVRLKNQFPNIINALSFGCVGDGVPTGDPLVANGTDNTMALQKAFDFLASQSQGISDLGLQFAGYTLYIPKGIYIISDEILIDRFISVMGEGAIIFNNDNTKKSFNFRRCYNNNISGIKFRNGTNQLYFTNNNVARTRVLIDGCWFSNASDYSIKFEPTSPANHMSCLCTINNPHFWATTNAIYNVCDQMVINNIWLTVVHKANTAALYNATGGMWINKGIGVPDTSARVQEYRWIDNYSRVYVNGFKFGREGTGGYTNVYHWSPDPVTGGGTETGVEIEKCIAGVATLEPVLDPLAVVVMKGLPGFIKIVNNEGIRCSNNSIQVPLVYNDGIDIDSILIPGSADYSYCNYTFSGNSGQGELLKGVRIMPPELLKHSNLRDLFITKLLDSPTIYNADHLDRNIFADSTVRNVRVALPPVDEAIGTVVIKKYRQTTGR